MSSENKALTRLRVVEKIIGDRKEITGPELEALMLYNYGVLSRTVGRYVDCLQKLNLIIVDGQTLKAKT